jgi:hypothetical protein
MVLPINYRKVGETAVASYDSFDILSGTSYVTLYCGRGTSINFLMNSATASEDIYTKAGITVADYTKIVDYDFDSLINKQITVQGKAYASIPIMILTDNGTSAYVVVKIRKWDGASETEIVSQQGTTFSTGATGYFWYRATIPLTVPLTIFRKGETMRVTVELWATTNAGHFAGFGYLGHDPMARGDAVWTSTTVSTQAIVKMPVKIDL